MGRNGMGFRKRAKSIYNSQYLPSTCVVSGTNLVVHQYTLSSTHAIPHHRFGKSWTKEPFLLKTDGPGVHWAPFGSMDSLLRRVISAKVVHESTDAGGGWLWFRGLACSS